jgi:hypothetical protein
MHDTWGCCTAPYHPDMWDMLAEVVAGSFHCCTTAAAPQVHLQPIPFYIIDVRSPEEAAAAPLAQWVAPAVNIPGKPVAQNWS